MPSLARDEAALRACLKANALPQALSQTLTIDQTDANGAVHRLAGVWYWQRADKVQRAVLKLSAPRDLAGASYLMVRTAGGESLYLYLPAVGKVRHVTGAAIAQSLFGSGLSAFDLKFIVGGLLGGTYTRIGATSLGGRSAERWRYLPPPDPEALYDRVDMVIDDAWCLPMKTELFGGVPWKTLTLDPTSVHQIDGRWSATRATLDDQRTSVQTRISLRDDPVGDLPDALFKPDRFYRTAP